MTCAFVHRDQLQETDEAKQIGPETARLSPWRGPSHFECVGGYKPNKCGYSSDLVRDQFSKKVMIGGDITPAVCIRCFCSGEEKNAPIASLDGAVLITTTLLGLSKFLCSSAIMPAFFERLQLRHY